LTSFIRIFLSIPLIDLALIFNLHEDFHYQLLIVFRIILLHQLSHFFPITHFQLLAMLPKIISEVSFFCVYFSSSLFIHYLLLFTKDINYRIL